MKTVQLTINDSLPFSKLKTALSLFRGIDSIEIVDNPKAKVKSEYEELKDTFFQQSRKSMSEYMTKYL